MASEFIKPWVGFDFDGTLAQHEKPFNMYSSGEPISKMIALANAYLDQSERMGYVVKIMTARVSLCPDPDELLRRVLPINRFCQQHFGTTLDVTCVKDYGMLLLFDDRAYGVDSATGDVKNFTRNRAKQSNLDTWSHAHLHPEKLLGNFYGRNRNTVVDD